MIASADRTVRDAFRATLRDTPSGVVLSTQEVDPSDVLEVTDLAHAIARAEAVLVARSGRSLTPRVEEEIEDALVATDDCAGPAVPATDRATPIPDEPAAPTASEQAEAAPETAPEPTPTPAPILVLDENAFYHPAGKIDGFATDQRSGLSLLARLHEHRDQLCWFVAALLTPIAVLALIGVAVSISAADSASDPSPTTPPRAIVAPNAPATPRIAPTTRAAESPPAVPVVDVSRLKSAPSSKRGR